jgi:anti-anti-sigma factor
MNRPFRHVEVEVRGDVFCVRFRSRRLDETGIYEMADELIALGQEEGCRKLALSLGPGSPEFLYSVFLSKLLTVQRRLRELGGSLKLCVVSPEVMTVFAACQLQDTFDFTTDFETAVAAWDKRKEEG